MFVEVLGLFWRGGLTWGPVLRSRGWLKWREGAQGRKHGPHDRGLSQWLRGSVGSVAQWLIGRAARLQPLTFGVPPRHFLLLFAR